MGGSKINGGGCGCGCSMRRIAGTRMWDDVARPTIEGRLGSDGLLPRIPFFELLLLAPDGVTGQATLAGMRLDAPRLRQLAQEAKLCTSLCPHIGGVYSAHATYDVYGQGVVVEAERECCVLEYVFSLSLKDDLRTLPPVEIGTFSTYLHTHMPKINSSPVKICKSSQQVLKKFSKLGLKKILNCSKRRSNESLFFCPRADLPFWSVPAPIFSEPGRSALTF